MVNIIGHQWQLFLMYFAHFGVAPPIFFVLISICLKMRFFLENSDLYP